MSNIVVDNMELTQEQYNMPATDFFNPIVLNQKPFVHGNITVGEFLEEQRYYADNYNSVLNGTYKPLWKQRNENSQLQQ